MLLVRSRKLKGVTGDFHCSWFTRLCSRLTFLTLLFYFRNRNLFIRSVLTRLKLPLPLFLFLLFLSQVSTQGRCFIFFKGRISNMTLTFRLILITFSKRLFGWCWRFLFILLTDFVCELPVSLVYVL